MPSRVDSDDHRQRRHQHGHDSPVTHNSLRSPASPSAMSSSFPEDSQILDRSDETAALLSTQHSLHSGYGSQDHHHSSNTSHRSRHHPAQLRRNQSFRSRVPSRRSSFGRSLPFGTSSSYVSLHDSATHVRSAFYDDRTWYDQFTSTDWIRDAIADAVRVKELRSRKDWRGRLQAFLDGAQGWVLVAFIGCITAGVAYAIDVTETVVFDYKSGYCSTGWWKSKRRCCDGGSGCDNWTQWNYFFVDDTQNTRWFDFAAFVFWIVLLALAACAVTLATKTNMAQHVTISTLDEDLGAVPYSKALPGPEEHVEGDETEQHVPTNKAGPKVYYPAAGSGVAEVKVILSGFVLHGYLGVRTLVLKSVALVLSVGSGMSVGKEGPYVHIATCVGNISSRMFSKYSRNDGKRREVLSASAAAGVAVAFGAPIGGVLFSLEEVSYYFPPKTLFRTFFCCIVAALSLKFLNPYGTGKIVLFQVRYLSDWAFIEIIVFAGLGILGGMAGALFIKACRFWATHFRRSKWIKTSPMTEVFTVALVTGLLSFWNRFTSLPVAELLYELAAPCDSFSDTGNSLCPTRERIPHIIYYLAWAFVVKAFLTIVTFGIKVPAGIYVPSMVVGGLMGRIIGHTLQYFLLEHKSFAILFGCTNMHDGNPEACVVPGVYALVAAGATMCGVTRLSVTLAVILFELTGSLEHVLPFCLGVLTAKWTADALEPASIYDLLTDMNAYPYLDSKIRPIFTSDLKDITPTPKSTSYIDVSHSPWVKATELRNKLRTLHMSGELDGGFPIIEDDILVGLIPAPDLEFALDGLEETGKDDADNAVECLLHPRHGVGQHPLKTQPPYGNTIQHDGDDEEHTPADFEPDSNDFTGYVDPAPVALDICSPMDLVFECFVKLGLRYVCVLEHGRYAGMVHKKTFVRYVKEQQNYSR